MRWDRRVRHWLRVRFAPVVRENWYRDVWLILITGALFWSQIGLSDVVERQRESRRAVDRITCAATSAVIDAGRATITGGAESLDPEFARNLEALGYPPLKVRKEQAEQAAHAYAEAIARRVEEATGATGIVNPNGTLDCRALVGLTSGD